MALTGCFSCLKYLVLIFNFLVFLAGLAVIASALWMYFDSGMYFTVSPDAEYVNNGIYIMLGVGVLMFVIGFLGCCGALRESQCCLATFFVLLLIIVVAQIVGAVWAYMNWDRMDGIIANGMSITVRKYYSKDAAKTETMDILQKKLKCCGSKGPEDYADAVYNGRDGDRNTISTGIFDSSTLSYNVPQSCCDNESLLTSNVCGEKSINVSAGIKVHIYTEGCADKVIDVLLEHKWILFGVALGLAMIEIFGMVFSLILCCAVRRIEDYKA